MAVREQVDYVLVYEKKPEYFDDEDDLRRWKNRRRLRLLFMDAMLQEGLICEEETYDKYVYVRINCSFERMCKEAEKIKLELPLKVETEEEESPKKYTEMISKFFKIEQTPSRFLTAPFSIDIADQFLGFEYKELFFRTAQRSLLVDYILNGINIRDKLSEPDQSAHINKGFAFMLLKKVFVDAFIFHDKSKLSESRRNSSDEEDDSSRKLSLISSHSEIFDHNDFKEGKKAPTDTRSQLAKAWTSNYRRQPLLLIRNYFGEKISFYFAWEGTLINSLVIPAVLGIVIFGIGVPVAIRELDYGQHFFNQSSSNSVHAHFTYYLEVIKRACDNIVTPWFALIICLWGAIFVEIWKRVKATQSFRWGVDHFHETEPNRPQFKTKYTRIDPILNTTERYYPVYLRLIKYATSTCVSLLMICVVLVSVTAVIILRLYIVTDYCPGDKNDVCQFLLGTLVPSLLNTISIMLLGKVYSWIAEKLTNWENHRTTSEYNSAHIIKLFAFQFSNTYASLFYLAFIRGRFSDFHFLNFKYVDRCCERSCQGSMATASGNCMSMLTFQVLVLMLVKPFPRFFIDIILPAIKKCYRMIFRSNQVVDSEINVLNKERIKPKLGSFTREEMTEKVILYGFLMLFAASFPLAPLIALITTSVDLRIDANRLLWWNRRPLAYRSEGIGIWYNIVQFVNLCGVVTNGLLIAFTSKYGIEKGIEWQLLFFILFEHVVFGVRFVISIVIPDVPQKIQLARRKEKGLVTQTLLKGLKINLENQYRSVIAANKDDDDGASPILENHREGSFITRRNSYFGIDHESRY